MSKVRVSGLAVVVFAALVVAALTPGASTAATRGLTARLELDHREVHQDKPVKGHLVLHNATGATINLNQGCTPKWTVVLGRGRHAPPVAFSLECGTEPFLVKSGTTRLRFTAITNGPPPLRRGRYRAFLVASDPSFPHARPVNVQIIAPH